jgi:hypothetical protein
VQTASQLALPIQFPPPVPAGSSWEKGYWPKEAGILDNKYEPLTAFLPPSFYALAPRLSTRLTFEGSPRLAHKRGFSVLRRVERFYRPLYRFPIDSGWGNNMMGVVAVDRFLVDDTPSYLRMGVMYGAKSFSYYRVGLVYGVKS